MGMLKSPSLTEAFYILATGELMASREASAANQGELKADAFGSSAAEIPSAYSTSTQSAPEILRFNLTGKYLEVKRRWSEEDI